jgi:ankyrin repeat protein
VTKSETRTALEMVKLLIAHGADIHYRNPITHSSVLQCFIQNAVQSPDNLQILDLLLEQAGESITSCHMSTICTGSKQTQMVNQLNKKGMNALLSAAASHKHLFVERLLNVPDVDVNVTLPTGTHHLMSTHITSSYAEEINED